VHELKVECWEGFRKLIDETLHDMQREQERINGGRHLAGALFRGLGNSDWGLETTLERSIDAAPTETLASYYQKIDRSKPAVESLTGKEWPDIPDWPDFRDQLDRSAEAGIDFILSNSPSIYRYLIYLRHHGFPSPLLDWTRSAYVAALFAFDSMDRCAKYVAIYVYIRDSLQCSGSDEQLFVVGPYIRTHPRHFLQQSQYSLCLQLQVEGSGDNRHCDYRFLSHLSALNNGLNSDIFLKILVPASERRRALTQLDSMNLNPYSLYSSEESLIRTIARRELLFAER
jgi:hypothetical protein